jgi:hypothetical protein
MAEKLRETLLAGGDQKISASGAQERDAQMMPFSSHCFATFTT